MFNLLSNILSLGSRRFEPRAVPIFVKQKYEQAEKTKTEKKTCVFFYTQYDKTVYMTMTSTLYDSIINNLEAGEV